MRARHKLYLAEFCAAGNTLAVVCLCLGEAVGTSLTAWSFRSDTRISYFVYAQQGQFLPGILEFWGFGIYRPHVGPALLVGRLSIGSIEQDQLGYYYNGKQNKVVPESFRIILRLYLGRPESKSFVPDGTPCVADTQGLLRRATVVAGDIVPVDKETDRHWEQGEDMSLLDFQVLEYRPLGKLVIADAMLRKKMAKFSLRELIRRSGLSQKAVYAVLHGKPVRKNTLSILRRTVESLLV